MRGKKAQNTVRIIGGDWRGRRLPVADEPGLRPSGDRCRETLFNWLQAQLPGARCADLFAGTGALGFEAASRGAAQVTLVERNPRLAAQLREAMLGLKARQVDVVASDALAWLRDAPPESLDLVFVDPPFEQRIGGELLGRIRTVLRAGGLVYLESPASRAMPEPGPGWLSWREQRLGAVRMQVWRKTAEPA